MHILINVKHIEVVVEDVIRPAYLMLCDRCYQVEWHAYWTDQSGLVCGKGRVVRKGLPDTCVEEEE